MPRFGLKEMLSMEFRQTGFTLHSSRVRRTSSSVPPLLR